ncbi:MAG: O-acetylhomoserine aminocarboxypropyltransferase/cysteine synthase family protein [Deinococcota bacterium]
MIDKSTQLVIEESTLVDQKADYAFETLQLHAGQEQADATTGARAVPIYATSSYVYDSAQHAADLFAGNASGNQYGRMHNPTVDAFVNRLVALEQGAAGVGLSSGQAATTVTLMTLAKPGAHIVLSNQLFGGTYSVINKILLPWGCEVSVVPPDTDAIAEAVQDNTVAVWCETIANPSCAVPDIAAIAEVCKAQGTPLIVDNTWGCGGYLCQPLTLGADVVVHSATKWIGGHGTFIGGAVIDGGTFDWANGKFPAFTKPTGKGWSYVDKAGETAFALRAYDLGLFTMGMTLSPYAASLGLQGLETLSLRVQRACDSALALAEWLENHPVVASVSYPGLGSSPCHATATKTLRHGFGAVLSFEARSEAIAHTFLDNVKLASHLANIGDAKTVVINPWTTTHASLSEAAKAQAGVSRALIRVSVGLESIDDIKRDFDQALGS